VPSETIDSLVLEHGVDPGFVERDFEGMELVVFDGVRDVLETERPTILLGVLDPVLEGSGSSSWAVVDFVRSYECEVVDPLNSGQRSEGGRLVNCCAFPLLERQDIRRSLADSLNTLRTDLSLTICTLCCANAGSSSRPITGGGRHNAARGR
jgi:hypothetical protein